MNMLDKIRAKQPKPPQKTEADKPKKKPGQRWGNPKTRLPHGARMEMIYNAETEMWEGMLVVGHRVCQSSARAVLTLCQKLDTLYRRNTEKKELDKPGAPA